MTTAPTPGIERVVLYGDLADTFGRVLPIKAENAAKAMSVIEANFPNQFFARLCDGSFFMWFGGEADVVQSVEGEDDLVLGTSCNELHVAPAPAGSEKGGIMAVLGTVVVGAAIVFSGGSLAAPLAALGSMGPVASTVAQMGLGLAISGIGMMISPQPSFETGSDKTEAESYIYGGGMNVMREGGAVPLNYGAPIITSTVLSGGLENEDIPIDDPSDDE